MAKKSKVGITAATAYGLAVQAGLAPDAESIYNMGEKAFVGAKNEIQAKLKKDKIKKLLIEIGDRVVSKKIKIDNKEIQEELECIKELDEKIKEKMS